MNGNGKVSITPLGGVGGVGNACFLVEHNGISVVMDCGLDPRAFHQAPDPNNRPVIPPPGLNILDERIKAGQDFYALLTHGHLDHVGAVAELIKRGIKEDHLLMSSWTSKVVRRHAQNLWLPLADGKPLPWKIVRERDRSAANRVVLNSNGVKCHIFPQNHSVHGTFGVSISTNRAKVVYLTDAKFYGHSRNIPDDENPGVFRDGKAWFDGILQQIRGQTGVDCLLLDVLNSDLEGFTPPEEEVIQSLEQIVSEAPGRVFISIISSNFQRIEEVIKMLWRKGKRIGFLGASINASYNMLQDRLLLFVLKNASPDMLGGFPLLLEQQCMMQREDESFRPSVIYQDWELQRELKDFLGVSDIKSINEAEVFLVSGTQGEPNSAFARLAEGTLIVGEKRLADGTFVMTGKPVQLTKSDWATNSGRVIPDSEDSSRRMILGLVERGGKVIVHRGETARIGLPVGSVEERFVHVSGHGQIEDLRRFLEKLEPRLVIPIHAPPDRMDLFEARFGSTYNIRRLEVAETLEI